MYLKKGYKNRLTLIEVSHLHTLLYCNKIKSHKNKHLNFKEPITIQLRLNKYGFSSYKIAKELNSLF